MNDTEMIKQMITDKNVLGLLKSFDLLSIDENPTENQLIIIRTIAFQEYPKITIKCCTQYGKSWSVSKGIALHKILHQGDLYCLVASQDKKTARLRNFIATNMFYSPILIKQLKSGKTGVSRMIDELSKDRMTFSDGAELSVHSAEGSAQRLMGFGGNILVIDESGEIPKEIYTGKIARMTGGFTGENSPKEVMEVEIGNPWDPYSHFSDHWNDPRTPEQGGWFKIHIPWQVGVEEGRFSQEYIDEQRKNLTPMEFRVLYDAEFPEEADDQLIKKAWIDKALSQDFKITPVKFKVGVDVAELGRDWTVMIQGYNSNGLHVPEDIFKWNKQDTMPTVGLIRSNLKYEKARINVDSTGVGSGVRSRLSELKYDAYAYKGGSGATEKRDGLPYLNLLSEFYWKLRNAFEEERIDLHLLKKYPTELSILISQLLSIKYKIQSDKGIKIIKPEDKSPDHADAFMLFIGEASRPGFYVPE